VLERMSADDRATLIVGLTAFNAAAGETSVGDLLPLGL
jgi:hypothetical protein